MTRERFTRLVEEALDDIPRRFRDAMKNVAVVVEDEPSQELLEDMEMEPIRSALPRHSHRTRLSLWQHAARSHLNLSTAHRRPAKRTRHQAGSRNRHS
jgi:predicted Zn-dependent protease with MMP-like domain